MRHRARGTRCRHRGGARCRRGRAIHMLLLRRLGHSRHGRGRESGRGASTVVGDGGPGEGHDRRRRRLGQARVIALALALACNLALALALAVALYSLPATLRLLRRSESDYAKFPHYLVIYAECPCYLVLYMQSVLIFAALHAKCP